MAGFTRNNSRFLIVLVLLSLATLAPVHSKVFRKCDLVKDLTNNGISRVFISSWVCLAMNESGMNSTLVTSQAPDVKSYGIFQINNKHWCRDDYLGGHCRMLCSDLIKDDLRPSINCAKTRFEREGFKDWPKWEKKCKNQSLPSIKECA